MILQVWWPNLCSSMLHMKLFYFNFISIIFFVWNSFFSFPEILISYVVYFLCGFFFIHVERLGNFAFCSFEFLFFFLVVFCLFFCLGGFHYLHSPCNIFLVYMNFFVYEKRKELHHEITKEQFWYRWIWWLIVSFLFLFLHQIHALYFLSKTSCWYSTPILF